MNRIAYRASAESPGAPLATLRRITIKYQSGEPIRKGDKVLFHGEPGEIEFTVEALICDPALDWYLKEYGPGAMVVDSRAGRTFIKDTKNAEDLVLVSTSKGK